MSIGIGSTSATAIVKLVDETGTYEGAYPNLSRLVWFEDGVRLRRFTEDLWGTDPRPALSMVAAYLLFIFMLQLWMSDRPALKLRKPLFAWNLSLSLISFASILRLSPDIAFCLRTLGFHKSLVFSPPLEMMDVQLFWGIVYGWFKLFELGDTLFLVLRKKPTTLLHMFHHATTLLVTAYASQHEEHRAFFRWFAYANSFVHVWMYAYFALVTWGVRLPRRVPMAITLLQITQMLFFLYCIYNVCEMEQRGVVRRRSMGFLRLCFVLCSFNLFLFSRFFYTAYVVGAKKRPLKQH